MADLYQSKDSNYLHYERPLPIKRQSLSAAVLSQLKGSYYPYYGRPVDVLLPIKTVIIRTMAVLYQSKDSNYLHCGQ